MKQMVAGLCLSFLSLVFAPQDLFAELRVPPNHARQELSGAEGMPAIPPMDGCRPEMAMPAMQPEHPLWAHLASLGLDGKQRESLREIESATLKESIRKNADMQIARIELIDILDKDQVNTAAVEGALKKIASLQADFDIIHILALERVKAMLAPDQRKRLKMSLGTGPMPGRIGYNEMRMAPGPPEERQYMRP
jgi:Spy/CpxP family protein refolding chaperone